MRVLIVDDSATNLVLLAQLVRSIDCTPLTYSDPTQALQEAPDLRIDLAIVDYKMPKLDGIELIAKLRTLPSFGDLPIVMVTASDHSQVRYSALEAGATDFLKKPIDAVEVKSRLRNLMKLREAQNKLRDRASWLAGEVRKATHTLAAREQEIIFRLSRATEYRDTDTGSHIVRMARYCRLIAEGMGLDKYAAIAKIGCDSLSHLRIALRADDEDPRHCAFPCGPECSITVSSRSSRKSPRP